MGQALYRKYRSKKLAEIVGQEPITKALDRALASGHISHAYLFTGPRGVGKTSIARILAHEVNKLSYDETANHLDIIEIDAASNRRIDEIRDLRDKVHVAPSSAPYKVYIVDEVHMLTKEAFNALLKTLEEPPAHVIFILATTEVHKLPETIVSRTQHYAFKPVSLPQVVEHLHTIAKQEKVHIDKDALELIAEHGQGSFRDSISLLDQVRNYGDHISRADVETILGVAPITSINTLISAVAKQDAASVVLTLQELRNQGVEATALSKQLGAQLRKELLENSAELPSQTSLSLQKDLLTIPTALEPFIALELCILGYIFASTPATATNTPPQKTIAAAVSPSPVKVSPQDVVAKTPVKKNEKKSSTAPKTKQPMKESTEEQPTPTPADSTPFTAEDWDKVLAHIKQQYNTMYGVLRMAEAEIHGNELVLKFTFAFHQKRVYDPLNKAIIIDAIQQLCGSSVEVSCVVAEEHEAKPKKVTTDSADIGTISNIFGGAELLES